MKRLVAVLSFILILIGCNNIPSQWVGPYLKKGGEFKTFDANKYRNE